MSITRVAQTSKSGDGTNFDHSVTFASLTIPAGALIVVKFSSPQSPNMNQPAGLVGDTFLHGPNVSTSSNNQDIWYVLSSVGGTAAITAALSNGSSEYGASVEVYTGGTWTYDSANSGTKAGSFSTSALTTNALSTSGAGLLATVFGQYNYPAAGNAATQTPGSVVSTGSDSTTIVMASGEVINSSAFSGTITVNINTGTPSATKLDVTYASFLSSGGASGVTGTLSATLSNASLSAAGTVASHGTLAATLGAAVLAAAGAVAIAGSGGGPLGGATLSGTAAVQASGALSQTLENTTLAATASAPAQGALSSTLGAATLSASGSIFSGIVGQLNAALAPAALNASGTVAVAGSASNTLAGAVLAATGTAHVSCALSTALGAATLVANGTASSGVHGSLNATLGPASLASAGQVSVRGALALTLDPATGSASGIVPITGGLNSTLGAVTLVATGRLPGASLPIDPLYFIQLPARSFYAAAPACSFYALSDPNMTQQMDDKDPGDDVVVTFDATARLDPGETLTGITKSEIEMRWGTDADISLVLSGMQVNTEDVTVMTLGGAITVASGKGVQGRASAGIDQCGYLMAITCTRSNGGAPLVLKGILPVSAQ